jgi:rRNA processing protein Gar1
VHGVGFKIFGGFMLYVRGKGLHTTSRGLVVRADQAPKMGQMALDSKGKRIGSVSDIFGPVKSPYVVIKPASGFSKVDLGKFINSDIYMGEMHGEGRKAKGMPRVRKR